MCLIVDLDGMVDKCIKLLYALIGVLIHIVPASSVKTK